MCLSAVTIPTALGGGFSIKHDMRPVLEENICDNFNWDPSDQYLPPGPIKWVKGIDGNTKALAVGSEGDFHRREVVATRNRHAN